MTEQADLLTQLSNALAVRAEVAKNAVVAVRLAHGRHITGMVWRDGIVVVSEQSLPRKDDFVACRGRRLGPDGQGCGTRSQHQYRHSEAGRADCVAINVSRAKRIPPQWRSRSERTELAARLRGLGSSISLAPNGIAAAAASSTGASCSIFALPAARRADRFSTPLALVWVCRPSAHAARSLSFRPQPSNASCRYC